MSGNYDKIKFSRYQQKNLDEGRGGHRITVEEAETVIFNPIKTTTQEEDGRLVYWGELPKGIVRVVVSATVSATALGTTQVGRVVTAFQDRSFKKIVG